MWALTKRVAVALTTVSGVMGLRPFGMTMSAGMASKVSLGGTCSAEYRLLSCLVVSLLWCLGLQYQ